MIKNLLNKIRSYSNYDNMDYVYVLYIVTTVLSFFNPLESTNVQEFKRIIGAGIVADYDCTRVIDRFNFWFLAFFFLSVFGLKIVSYFKDEVKKRETNHSLNYLDLIVCCGILNNLIIGLNFFSGKEKYLSSYIIGLAIIAEVLFLLNNRLSSIGEKYYHYLFWSAFAWAWGVSAIITPGRFRTGFGIGTIILFGFFIFLSIFLDNKKDKSLKNKFYELLPCVSCIVPLTLSMFVEIINISNQHRLFISSPRIAVCLVLVITVIFCFTFFRNKLAKIGNYFYALLLMGIAAVRVQLPLIINLNSHIFESANYSVLISDCLYYGDIPIIQHYGGHMLSGVLEGIAYGVLNGDYFGASFAPYSSYITVLTTLLFYKILRIIFDEEYAFSTTLFLPFYERLGKFTNMIIPFDGYWSYYGLGALISIAIISFNNKKTIFNAVQIWLSLGFCILYRLDLGFAFTVATIVALIYIICITNERRQLLEPIVNSLVLVGICTLIMWSCLCLIKGVNPLMRVLEFIYIGLSNMNWAYEGIGNRNHIAFAWCYMVVPMITGILLVYLLFSQNLQEKISLNGKIVLLMLSISYFANFSRGLVRHSVAEMAIILITWSSFVFIAIMLALISNKRLLFLPVICVLMLINSLIKTHNIPVSNNLIDGAANQIAPIVSSWRAKNEYLNGQKMTMWKKLSIEEKRVDRVSLDTKLEKRVAPLREVVNELLLPHETYLDMMNRSFMYSILARRNPVYVSQSPLQLSGEFTQEQFINEMKAHIDRIPIVIFAKKDDYLSLFLDGIANAFRYYKVSEFIYQNYVPLCSIDEFMVWCDKRRYEDMLAKVALSKYLKRIDYGYDGPIYEYSANSRILKYGETHVYNINHLARIWGELDKKQAYNNKLLSGVHKMGNVYVFENIDFVKESGNYISLEAKYEQPNNIHNEAKLHIGVLENGMFTEKYYFGFTPKPGLHKYLFRVSCDYYWYADKMNAVYLEHNGKLSEISMKVLEGD